MRTTSFSSVQYKFLTAMALVAMVLAALPAMPAYAASITVTNTSDDLTTGNGCSLREAIINANNNGSTYPDCTAGSGAAADVITLASGSMHILSLPGASATTTGDLDISDPAGLTIQASSTTAAVIDGGDIDRVLDAALGSGNLTLISIIVTNGTTTSGTTGGGISFGSNATLTLTNSTVSNNVATATAGCGAGIYNNTAAIVNITNSTIQGNSCSEVGADGGGLFKGSGGTLNITNSTFSGNSANDDGGGLRLDSGAAAITNSTFYNNTAGNRGGAVQVSGATVTIEFSTFSANTANAPGNNGGGAVQISAGSAAINRSILADSTAGMACHQSGAGTGVFTNSLVEQNANCTGSITSTADPALVALASNGGPTQTMAITASSPAFNAAASCNSVTTDQRGFARPQGSACDLGAFEVDSAPTVVSVVAASPNPTSAPSVNYTVTFSEAVTGVGSSDFVLTIGGGLTGASVGTVSGSGTTYTVSVNTGTGNGTIRLDVPLSASLLDLNGNAFAGPAFITGDVYSKFQNAPGVATLSSPNGSISTAKPTYTWNSVFDTTWYYLWVSKVNGDGSLTTVHTKWYDASLVCAGGTCSIMPDVILSAGNYRWWIQTYNDADYGPWSSPMNFSVPVFPAPGAATLTSPNGGITDTTPAYTWSKVNASTWYYLWLSKVNDDGSLTTVHTKWYDSVDVCSGATCSITPVGVTLTSGNYRWWIQTYNDDGGYGAWSSAMNFSLPFVPAPGAATLVSPNGTIADTTPAYTWNKVNASTWYYLWVSQVNGDGSLTTIHTKWYDSVDVCSGATCSITPVGVDLSSGNYRWWIQTYSDDGGYGAWSSLMNFTLP